MKIKNYLLLCAGVSLVVALTVLYVPGVATSVERQLLIFLSTNAR